jgi:hypothetical protein
MSMPQHHEMVFGGAAYDHNWHVQHSVRLMAKYISLHLPPGVLYSARPVPYVTNSVDKSMWVAPTQVTYRLCHSTAQTHTVADGVAEVDVISFLDSTLKVGDQLQAATTSGLDEEVRAALSSTIPTEEDQ